MKKWIKGVLVATLAVCMTVGTLVTTNQQAHADSNAPYFYNVSVPLNTTKPANWPYTAQGVNRASTYSVGAPYLFIAGGTTDAQVTPTLAFFRYDMSKNVWTQLANLPSALQSTTAPLLAAGYDGNHVWAFNNNQLWMWTYTGGQGSWSQISLPDSNSRDLNYTFLADSIGVSGNTQFDYLYFGGGGSNLKNVWAYNTQSNTWISGPTLPSVNEGMGAIDAGGNPFCIFWQDGGQNGDVYRLYANGSSSYISKVASFGEPLSSGMVFPYNGGFADLLGFINNQPLAGTIQYINPQNGITTPVNFGPNIMNQDGTYDPFFLYTSWGWHAAGVWANQLYIINDMANANGIKIYADATAPVVNGVAVSGNPSIITNPNIQLLVNATDNIAIKEFQVSNDGFATVQHIPVNQAGVTNFPISWTVTPGTGSKTIAVRAVDYAGNVGSGQSVSLYYQYNTTAPTSSLVLNNGATETQNASINASVSAVSKQTSTTQLSLVVSMDGVNFYTLSGAASNPTFTAVSNPSSYYANTFMPNFTIPLNGSIAGGSSAAGNKYVYAIVTDPNGNSTILSQSINYNPPGNTVQPTTSQTSLSVTNNSNGPYTNGTVASINGTPTLISTSNAIQLSVSNVTNASQYRISTDGGITTSDWQAITGGQIQTGVTFQNDGLQNLYLQLSNGTTQSQWYTYSVLVDHTAPQVSVETQSGATATSSGTSINLSVQATDNISGLPLYYSVNGSSYTALPSDGTVPVTVNSGRNTFMITVKDTAGNTTTKTIRIDGL